MTQVINKIGLLGGQFLLEDQQLDTVFIPEDISEEQEMFKEMALEFVTKKVIPLIPRIDKQEFHLVEELLEEAGELGLLGAGLPEQYGGLGVRFNTETILSEVIGPTNSYSVAFAAHTGIGTLPILYYGTDAQKEKYIPGLASGKIKSAYCLTEPGSGSDALAAKTKATLTEDGKHYLLEGQKMWITNSGFADIFIVFAQVNGNEFTGFIVPADAENVKLGAEEDKLGIKGSSTRQVFFEGVTVSKDNVLGEIGKGHKIAFNVLNIGRYKLCVMCLGGSKTACDTSIKYANEREQFGQPIAQFGAIKHKLAEQAIHSWVCESATYRVSGLIQDKVTEYEAQSKTRTEGKLLAAEDYAIECALLKILGSETLEFNVDEAVQIHGGNGFSEEFSVARAYRDSRINRIFEGTNEINRLLSVGMLIKKGMKGELDILTPAMEVQKELMSVPSFGNANFGPLAQEQKALLNAKKAFLIVSGGAIQKFMLAIEKEQEIIMAAADVLLDIFAAESAILRTLKLIEQKGEQNCQTEIDITQVYVSTIMSRIQHHGKEAIMGFAEGDMKKMMLMGLKRFTKHEGVNVIAARRRIADTLIEANGYCL